MFFRYRSLEFSLIIAFAFFLLSPSGYALEVRLEGQTHDALAAPIGDFKSCDAGGKCLSVLVPLVEPDENVDIPDGSSRDDFLFLQVPGFYQGRPGVKTIIGLEKRGDETRVHADFNNNRKLDEGPALSWPPSRTCIELQPPGKPGIPSTLKLCRHSGEPGLRTLCEDNKRELTWAVCSGEFFSAQIENIAYGELPTAQGKVKIGVADANGDGSIEIPGPDRLLIDWDGDGVLGKSLGYDGFELAVGRDFHFSVGGHTFLFQSVAKGGRALRLQPLSTYNPAYEIRKPIEGRAAPDFEFLPMEDDSTRLSNFRGHKVLLNFWSFKDPQSLEELTKLREFNHTFVKRGWKVISLTADPERDQAETAARKHGVNWMLGLVDAKVIQDYASQGLPVNFIIDEKGVLEKSRVQIGRDAWR